MRVLGTYIIAALVACAFSLGLTGSAAAAGGECGEPQETINQAEVSWLMCNEHVIGQLLADDVVAVEHEVTSVAGYSPCSAAEMADDSAFFAAAKVSASSAERLATQAGVEGGATAGVWEKLAPEYPERLRKLIEQAAVYVESAAEKYEKSEKAVAHIWSGIANRDCALQDGVSKEVTAD